MIKDLIKEEVTDGCFSMLAGKNSLYTAIENASSTGWTVHYRNYNFTVNTVEESEVIKKINEDWKIIVSNYFDADGEVKPLEVRENGKNYLILNTPYDKVDMYSVIVTGKIHVYDLNTVNVMENDKKKVDEVLAHLQEKWKEKVLSYVE